jgi:hypothetical protein
MAARLSPALGVTDSRPALRAGLASVSITPGVPVWLYGYADKRRFRPFEGVLDDIHAKALAVEGADGEKAVLITADLCVLRQDEEVQLSRQIMARTGLTRRQILLNWSHTHSGPAIGASDVNRYPIGEEDLRRTKAYTEELAEKLGQVAAAALADLSPATLCFGKTRVGFVNSRRQYDEHGRYRRMGPNPQAHADRTVPLLRIASAAGKLRALVFGCACHGVTLGSDNIKLSGDYAGMAQQELERRLPGVQAMFMAGCGADANPDPRCGPQQEEFTRRHGASLAEEVERLERHALPAVRGPFQAQLAWVDLPLVPPPAPAELQRLARGPFWQSHNAKRMLDAQQRGERLPTHYRAPLALWQFGRDLTLVAIAGEVVSDYVPLVEKALGPERLWVAGYSNQVFGYLPSARIVAEGGYEALGFPSGPIGWFSTQAQDVLLAQIRKMARQAGRELPNAAS